MRRFPIRLLTSWLLVVLALGVRDQAFLAAATQLEEQVAPRPVRYTLRTMGTVGSVVIVTPDSAASAAAASRALDAFGRVDARLSNWNPQSELSAVNDALDSGAVALSAEAATVIRSALQIAEESRGAFDPTVEPLVRLWGFLGGTPHVPVAEAITSTLERTGYHRLQLAAGSNVLEARSPGLRIDLGGIAKGHAVDLAIESLLHDGIEHALVDLSGNMRAVGHPPNRTSWTLGVRDPDTSDSWFATLRLGTDAVATSGNYEQFVSSNGKRYGHVIDPRSGWPVDGLDAVTVLAPTAMLADGWATALLVQGLAAARETAHARGDLAAILVQSTRDGRRVVWVESSLEGRFDLVTGAVVRFEVRWF